MSINAQTFIVDTPALFDRLEKYQSTISSEYVVFDVETDSKLERVAKVYGMGLCFDDTKAFYIPWRTPQGTEVWDAAQSLRILNWVTNVCQTKKLIGHNISYDVLVMENNFNISLVDYIYSDTILLKHTLDEEPPFALKEIAVAELGDWADKAQETLKESVVAKGGRWTKEDKDMYLADTAILGEYCCWDVLLTFKLFNKFQARLIAEGLHDLFYKDEIMDLYRWVTIPMKRKGVRIDLEHFQDLKVSIEKDLVKLEAKIQEDIKEDVYLFVTDLLNKDHPVKNKGSFPKALAEIIGAPLPITKDGKVTMAKGAIEKQKAAVPVFDSFYDWILGTAPLTSIHGSSVLSTVSTFSNHKKVLRMAQEKLFFAANPDRQFIFNLSSNDHLAHLLFEVYRLPIDPRAKTPGGKPQVNEEVISSYEGSLPIVDDLIMLKKMNKLLGTNVNGILDREQGGRIYASLLQFGTTSGRYASRNPNLQNLPRVPEKSEAEWTMLDKYTAAIRKGFISDEGCSFIDADYAALEPRCFSHVSGDKKLIELWEKGEDMYSRIAIDVFDLQNISAHPKDANFLKKVDPAYRQKSKVFCLAVPYGAEAGRIGQAMNCSRKEAQLVIDKYLKAYPGLRSYMSQCHVKAKTTGKVVTAFGRVRHLSAAHTLYALHGDDLLDFNWAKRNALSESRGKMKNLLNNAKNFPIQGLAGHIINRAMIAIAKQFRARGLDAYLSLMIHDQVIVNSNNSCKDEVLKIVQDCMENTTKISVPLIAEPQIATNLADSH